MEIMLLQQKGSKRHTTYIHLDEDTKESKDDTKEKKSVESSYAGSRSSSGVAVPTVTVLVNGKQHIQALLDSGSTTTFCFQKLVETLGVKVYS